MAVVNYDRLAEGTSISGKYGETLKITERWQIRVDTPQTSKLEIVLAVTGDIGITYGSPHPDIPALLAMEFELSPVGRDGMRWTLTVQFYVPPEDKRPKENGIPEDAWQRSGGSTTVPAFADKNGSIITNSAGDPLEGLEKEREEASWTLTKFYENDDDLESDILAAAGKVNSENWAGTIALTWKCYFKGAKKVSVSRLDGSEDGGTLEYIEAQWEFRLDESTWKLMPWDIGFMAFNSSGEKVAITTDDGKAVKQPVGLASDGSALAPGEPPFVINGGDGVEIYNVADFATIFGEPCLICGSGS
jgi:hypothetical protein